MDPEDPQSDTIQIQVVSFGAFHSPLHAMWDNNKNMIHVQIKLEAQHHPPGYTSPSEKNSRKNYTSA